MGSSFSELFYFYFRERCRNRDARGGGGGKVQVQVFFCKYLQIVLNIIIIKYKALFSSDFILFLFFVCK